MRSSGDAGVEEVDGIGFAGGGAGGDGRVGREGVGVEDVQGVGEVRGRGVCGSKGWGGEGGGTVGWWRMVGDGGEGGGLWLVGGGHDCVLLKMLALEVFGSCRLAIARYRGSPLIEIYILHPPSADRTMTLPPQPGLSLVIR